MMSKETLSVCVHCLCVTLVSLLINFLSIVQITDQRKSTVTCLRNTISRDSSLGEFSFTNDQ